MKIEESLDSLNDYLEGVFGELDSKPIVEKIFSELALKLPTYTSDGVLHHDDIEYLANAIDNMGLRTEPKLSHGYIERGIDAPIIFYLNKGDVNFDSMFYKYARLVVQVAVIMARADREVDSEEILSIETLIFKQKGVTNQEKMFLLAKAKYLLSIDGAYDEQYRDYVKIALSKQSTIKKIEELSDNAKLSLLEVAKEVAVADGYLDIKELKFIQEIYRLLGVHARKAKKDIEEFAKSRYITLESVTDKMAFSFDEETIDEIDDVIGDLLSDFDEF